MPTFTGPVVAGEPTSVAGRDDPANRLWRHFGAWARSVTVWKDSLGAWHQSSSTYEGGGVHRTFDNGELVSETVESSVDHLADADVVYLGGHVTPITDAQAAELVAAGFAVGGHWESEEQKWVDYAVVSAVNAGWKGGDACASQQIGDGRTLWTFADNIVGDLDADGYPTSINVSRNALVLQDDTGAITGQVLIGGTEHTPFRHPTSGHWWWPLDITLNGVGTALTDVVVAALHFQPGSLFGDFVGNDLLIINAFGVVDSSVEVTLWGGDWEMNTVYNDSDYHYITANQVVDLTTLTSRTILARAPLGELTTAASWENWDGSGWSTGDPAVLGDNKGAPLTGSTSITKSGDWWVLAAVDFYDPQVRLYRATDPQGPYTPYHTGGAVQYPQGLDSDPKTRGGEPDGGKFVYYQPKFHEQLAPGDQNLVVSYNRNVFSNDFPNSLATGGDSYHVSTFCPQFVYLPAPEAT